jgi:hypothetical protein
VNLQEVKGEAKPYQIRQFLRLVERQNLRLEEGTDKDYHINIFLVKRTAVTLPTFRISKPVQPSEALQKRLWQRWNSLKLHGLKPRAGCESRFRDRVIDWSYTKLLAKTYKNKIDLYLAPESAMKQKISVRLDAEIVQLAKQRAAKERQPLSDLIQDALAKYLRKDAATPEERQKAFQLFCEQPMRLSGEQLRQVLQEEVWDP